MIVTDRLVFLHLHKSGGTFVNALLMHCMPSARQLGYHLPYRELPAIYRDLLVVGTVRSPWDYYVSWYHFQRSLEDRNILFQLCSDDGRLGFKETVTNLIGLSGDEPRLARLRAEVPDNFVDHGLNLTKKCVDELRERQLGFYSFLYERLYAGAENPTIMRMERLRRELRALVRIHDLSNECVESFLNESPSLNVSEHDSAAAYFDDELATLVAERDRSVAERHGYSFP
jgi:hypothetical protein